MRVLICGSRGWHQAGPIGELLDTLLAEHGASLVVIHGGAKGADSLAHAEASRRGIRTIVEKAQWNRYGNAAGPIRNQKMLNDHRPDAVHAFRSEGKSSGTDDMVARARRARVPVFVHTLTVTTTKPKG